MRCDLCGSQKGVQPVQVDKVPDAREARTPGRRQMMFRALTNVLRRHLADSGLFDFAGRPRD